MHNNTNPYLPIVDEGRDFLWIPYILVALALIAFLMFSFYKYHQRIMVKTREAMENRSHEDGSQSRERMQAVENRNVFTNLGLVQGDEEAGTSLEDEESNTGHNGAVKTGVYIYARNGTELNGCKDTRKVELNTRTETAEKAPHHVTDQIDLAAQKRTALAYGKSVSFDERLFRDNQMNDSLRNNLFNNIKQNCYKTVGSKMHNFHDNANGENGPKDASLSLFHPNDASNSSPPNMKNKSESDQFYILPTQHQLEHSKDNAQQPSRMNIQNDINSKLTMYALPNASHASQRRAMYLHDTTMRSERYKYTKLWQQQQAMQLNMRNECTDSSSGNADDKPQFQGDTSGSDTNPGNRQRTDSASSVGLLEELNTEALLFLEVPVSDIGGLVGGNIASHRSTPCTYKMKRRKKRNCHSGLSDGVSSPPAVSTQFFDVHHAVPSIIISTEPITENGKLGNQQGYSSENCTNQSYQELPYGLVSMC